ncbi:GAF domain-containing protein [Jatrophihabitans endophyticus]|uniref:GAF domain-containing protein n=1 Tax=Jatrophihabitans endophyticus TaxID=1206085 RepID=A0A1M5LS92_9ACTN|nr:GAF domain-containing protein [Jatrophihabitans endophyticus]SHG67770.1 GAF domain-containing protein [Jatrophihabitans endophyticus]
MTSPPRSRLRLGPRGWTAVNYASAAAIVVLGALGGASHGIGQALLVGAAAVLAVVQLVAQQRRERAAKSIADETRTVTVNAASNAFAPLLGLLVKLAEARTETARRLIRAQVTRSVAYAASYAIGPDLGVRSCVFLLADGGRELRWSGVHAGRPDEPHSVFTAGTVRGDLALAMIADDGVAFCADTEAAPPPGWAEGHPHTYRTFLAVPVRAAGRAWGMLTVDSLTAGDLDPGRDRPILVVLAHILAVSRASADADADDPPSRTPRR